MTEIKDKDSHPTEKGDKMYDTLTKTPPKLKSTVSQLGLEDTKKSRYMGRYR